jgi:hypothetical protein
MRLSGNSIGINPAAFFLAGVVIIEGYRTFKLY